tara:strand:+ start:6376 stop:7506 length:1131 start_codon:yes stop_codon:yes gene_type:complete
MAQHDYDIANQTGANFRADLNNALDAIVSNNSGSSEPSTTFAYEWWIDTSANVLKLRNSANNAWITLPLSITASNETSGALTVNGNLTTTGILDADGGVTVDNITIDGTEIDLSSGDLTIDSAGDIILDADGGNVTFKDGGTTIGDFVNSSSDFVIESKVQDKDIIFKGDDGGGVISALTLDMSEAGNAIFNGSIDVGGSSITRTGDLTLDVSGDINLDADGGDINLKDGGTTFGGFTNSSSDFVIQAGVADKDIKFQGTDGSSLITALTLDISEAGAATFNDNVTAFSDERLKDNIETLEHGLAKVEQLRGVTYIRDGKENIGVIAQEVEKILPEIVLIADDEMGTKSVDYSRITAVLIEAVKDLSAKIKELESK